MDNIGNTISVRPTLIERMVGKVE